MANPHMICTPWDHISLLHLIEYPSSLLCAFKPCIHICQGGSVINIELNTIVLNVRMNPSASSQCPKLSTCKEHKSAHFPLQTSHSQPSLSPQQSHPWFGSSDRHQLVGGTVRTLLRTVLQKPLQQLYLTSSVHSYYPCPHCLLGLLPHDCNL